MQSSRRSFAYTLFALALALLATQAASAQAIPACQATNGLLTGPYGFVLNAGTFFPAVAVTPPGSTPAVAFQALATDPPGTNPYSSTELGRLLGGINGNSPGVTAGQLFFDGNGSVFAASTVGGPFSSVVGSYVVNPDCTVTISLNDVFSTSTPVRSLAFTGILANGGAEIDVVPTSQLPGTTTPSTSRAFVQFVRVAANNTCSAATLSGAYALVGFGFQAATTPTTGTPVAALPFPFLARLRFDGNGSIVSEPTTSASTPLASFQYTGSYVVNADCTGLMSFSRRTTTGTTTTTGPVMTAAFVITNPIAQVGPNGLVAFQNPFSLRPSFIFSLTNQDQSVSGIGKAQ